MCQPQKSGLPRDVQSGGRGPDLTLAETRDQLLDLILHCDKRLCDTLVPNMGLENDISVFFRQDFPLSKNPANVFQIHCWTHHNKHQTPSRSQCPKSTFNKGVCRSIAIVKGRDWKQSDRISHAAPKCEHLPHGLPHCKSDFASNFLLRKKQREYSNRQV